MKFELRPNSKDYSDEFLLNELRRVAKLLGLTQLPQRVYELHGCYPISAFKRRFHLWTNALVQAGLRPTKCYGASNDELLEDLRRVAAEAGQPNLTRSSYGQFGKFSTTLLQARFGGWNKALDRAGILSRGTGSTGAGDDDLFANIEVLWRHFGRQPSITELHPPLSRFSSGPYKRRFGTWRKALEAFVSAMNNGVPLRDSESTTEVLSEPVILSTNTSRRTPRQPNWRQRFLVLRRDGFRCRACGRSPATQPGVELEVDHVKAWSKGGETEIDNLQTLCVKCNGGKGSIE